MNNNIKLAAVATAVVVSHVYSKFNSNSTSQQDLTLDEIHEFAIAQIDLLLQQAKDLTQENEILLAQNKYLIDMIDKHGVEPDAFDRIALPILFHQ